MWKEKIRMEGKETGEKLRELRGRKKFTLSTRKFNSAHQPSTEDKRRERKKKKKEEKEGKEKRREKERRGRKFIRIHFYFTFILVLYSSV